MGTTRESHELVRSSRCAWALVISGIWCSATGKEADARLLEGLGSDSAPVVG